MSNITKTTKQSLFNSEKSRDISNFSQSGSIAALAVEKEAKQMEIAMITAKRFPRDYTDVELRIERNCTRKRLAEIAEYSYPRGGERVAGASVKLLEVIAQCFGNIEFGVNELQRYPGYSEVEAFAWDFETNVKVARKFQVPHFRDTKQGRKPITEDRDIREMVFNYGSRNMRACLERVIPRDLVDTALDICKQTLRADTKGLADRVKKCKQSFADNYTIDGKSLEKIIGEKLQNWNIDHLNAAIKIYNALEGGETTKKELLESASIKKTTKNSLTEDEKELTIKDDEILPEEAEDIIEIDEDNDPFKE